MGNHSSASTTASTATEVATVTSPSSSELLANAIKHNGTNLYELLDFKSYSKPTKEQVDRAFRKASPKYHPDKYTGTDEEHRKNLHDQFILLCEAREMLLDDKLKEKYDKVLKQRNNVWSWKDFAWERRRKLFTGVVLLGGLVVSGGAVQVAWLTTVVEVFPSFAAAGAVGSALVSAGAAGLISEFRNPDQGACRLAVEMTVAGLIGACVAGKLALDGLTVLEAVGADVGATAAEVIGSRLALRILGGTALSSLLSGGVAATGMLTDAFKARSDRFSGPIAAVKCRSFYYRVLSDRSQDELATPKPSMTIVSQLLRTYGQANGVSEYEQLAEDLDNYTDESQGFKSMSCLKAYTTNADIDQTLNRALKSPWNHGIPTLYFFAHYIYNMRLELKLRAKSLKYYAEDKPLWRGALLSDAELKTWARKGQVFLNPTFMSTSRNKAVAEGFRTLRDGNAIVEIDCSKNLTKEWGLTYAVDVDSISHFSGTEKEVLFYPFSGFRVVSVTSNWVEGKKIYQIKLHTLDTLEVERLSGTTWFGGW